MHTHTRAHAHNLIALVTDAAGSWAGATRAARTSQEALPEGRVAAIAPGPRALIRAVAQGRIAAIARIAGHMFQTPCLHTFAQMPLAKLKINSVAAVAPRQQPVP